jgi:molybdopterin converting factor small subunit
MARRIRVRFFGRLRDVAGGGDREFPVPDHVRTADQLIAWLAAEEPELGAALSVASVKAAVGDTIIARDADIRRAAEVSFLPPFSGG